MKRKVVMLALGAVVAAVGLQTGGPRLGHAATVPGTQSNFKLIGHEPLFNRGMNAAPAIYSHFMFIGSRSDGSHLHSGVQIVDISHPSNPRDVGEIPYPTTIPIGYTSRELRVWPQQKVLMVMYFGCSALIHACETSLADAGEQPFRQIDFFDLSGITTAAPVPALTTSYKPLTTPHEMFLWLDPKNAARAILYWTSPNNSAAQLVATDISGWKSGVFKEISVFSAVTDYSQADQQNYDVRLHSLSISPDGNRGYLAYLGGGVLVIDTSQVAAGVTSPKITLVTPVSGRAYWNYEGAHSSVPIPGKPYILTTEEIYGKGTPAMQALFGPAFGGCPWGWVRIVDMTDPTNLKVVSEFKIDENNLTTCPAAQDNYSSYTSHNPTVLKDIAFVTWHSGGLRAIELSDPTHPVQDGFFVPKPDALQPGHTPDPALEAGSNGTIAWSYPIIRNGLIYYVDIANGVYIVRYTGPHAREVNATSFLEGNSNVGGTAKPEQSLPASRSEPTPAPMIWPLLVAGCGAVLAAGAALSRRRPRRMLVTPA